MYGLFPHKSWLCVYFIPIFSQKNPLQLQLLLHTTGLISAHFVSKLLMVQIFSWFTVASGFSLCINRSSVTRFVPSLNEEQTLMKEKKKKHLHFVSLLPLRGSLHTDIDDTSNVPELIHFVGRFKCTPVVQWD
jgi:hypothetical protein